MEISYPDHLPREMNVTLVQHSDGWRIQFVADTGDIWEQDQPPFATREEAQAMVNQMTAELVARHGATTTKPM